MSTYHTPKNGLGENKSDIMIVFYIFDTLNNLRLSRNKPCNCANCIELYISE